MCLLGGIAAATALFVFGCEASGIGDPCIPEEEYTTSFSGFDDDEVNIESRSFQCESRVCLVNHFQGRVSCPYGQSTATAESSASGGTNPDACKIPGTDGTRAEDLVSVPVPPQVASRQAERAVYCSCRCANASGGTDDGASYCKCPRGFECEPLNKLKSLGKRELAGSYCIRRGTRFDSTAVGAQCERDPNDPSRGTCGEAQPF